MHEHVGPAAIQVSNLIATSSDEESWGVIADGHGTGGWVNAALGHASD
ncbi:MAG: hypothetical protein R2754_13435 [Microthrixaceae bacterium]